MLMAVNSVNPDGEIIVVAEPGRAGEQGADHLRAFLADQLQRPILVSLPPNNAKDTRAWATAPEREGTPWQERGVVYVEGLRANPLRINSRSATLGVGQKGGLATNPSDPATPCASSPGGSSTHQLRTITVTTEERDVADQGIVALAEQDQDIYQRSGSLVTVASVGAEECRLMCHPPGYRIKELPHPTIRERLSSAALWVREIRGEEGSSIQDVHVPDWCVKAVAARGQWDKIRPLAAVIDHPVIRRDGSVLSAPGYDQETGLYLSPLAPSITIHNDTELAVNALVDPLVDFPFAKPSHKAAWLCALLTPLARFAFSGPAPLFLCEANTPASGKGLLCDLVSLILTGDKFPTAPYHHKAEELTKSITAIAITGERLVLLDNIVGSFGNSALDAALTSTVWRDRVLGENRQISLPLWAVWFATANNVVLVGDIGRRIVPIRLHAREEFPDQRHDFKHGPEEQLRAHVRQHRGELLGAGLTILHNYISAGRPDMHLSAFGSFNGWSDLVRSAVMWATNGKFGDPAGDRQELRKEADSELTAMAVILGNWHKLDAADNGLTLAALLRELGLPKEKSTQSTVPNEPDHLDDMRDAITTVCPNCDANKLSRIIRRYHNRTINNLCFVKHGQDRNSTTRWRVSAPIDTAPETDNTKPSLPF